MNSLPLKRAYLVYFRQFLLALNVAALLRLFPLLEVFLHLIHEELGAHQFAIFKCGGGRVLPERVVKDRINARKCFGRLVCREIVRRFMR